MVRYSLYFASSGLIYCLINRTLCSSTRRHMAHLLSYMQGRCPKRFAITARFVLSPQLYTITPCSLHSCSFSFHGHVSDNVDLRCMMKKLEIDCGNGYRTRLAAQASCSISVHCMSILVATRRVRIYERSFNYIVRQVTPVTQ